MQRYGAKLDKISGYFFLAGLVISKLKMIPLVLLTSILNLISLIAYLIGYIAWFLATLLHPNNPTKREIGYGMLKPKNLYQISSILGTIATIFCLAVPSLILPAVWFYMISNSIWAVAEYHKHHYPPVDDPTHSSKRHAVYLRYVVIVLAISTLIALSTTIAFAIPQLSIALIFWSSIIGNSLTLISLFFLQKSIFNKYEPDVVGHSYATLSNHLSFDLKSSSLKKELTNSDSTSVPIRLNQSPNLNDNIAAPSDFEPLVASQCISI